MNDLQIIENHCETAKPARPSEYEELMSAYVQLAGRVAELEYERDDVLSTAHRALDERDQALVLMNRAFETMDGAFEERDDALEQRDSALVVVDRLLEGSDRMLGLVDRAITMLDQSNAEVRRLDAKVRSLDKETPRLAGMGAIWNAFRPQIDWNAPEMLGWLTNNQA